jgi:hypothetical protein
LKEIWRVEHFEKKFAPRVLEKRKNAFPKRFLRENSNFLVSENFKTFPKTIENQSNSTKFAITIERALKNCSQSAKLTFQADIYHQF